MSKILLANIKGPTGDVTPAATAAKVAAEAAAVAADADRVAAETAKTDAEAAVAGVPAAVAAAVAPKLDKTEAAATYAPLSVIIKGSRTIVFGDSIDADVKGWYFYFAAQSKKVQTIRNAGKGGDRTDMMLARIQADVLDYNPDIVILGATTNDQGQGYAESVTRANVTTMVDMVLAAGATPILRTTPPVDGAGTGIFDTVAKRRQAVLRHNAWLRAFAAARGLDVLDIYQSVVDPLTGGYKAGITSDGIHPTEVGSKAIADYLLALGVPAVFKGGFSFARAVTDESNMLKNGVFVGDANADGVADSWFVAAGAPTSTLTAAATGITGNWQRATAADGTSAALAQDIQAVDGACTVYAIGDTVEYCGRVRTSGTGSAIVRVSMWSAAASPADPVASTTLAITDGVFSGRAVIPTGTTKIRVLIQNQTAAGWIEVAEVAMRNLTQLGQA